MQQTHGQMFLQVPSFFYFSTGSDNTISKGTLANPSHIALASVYATPTTISKVTVVFNENMSFDPNFPPSSSSYSVQNVMTHEFGHWLNLADQYGSSCSEVTMYGYISLGETKKITLEDADKNAINWQYP